MINWNQLNNPHSHQYNPEILEKNLYDNKNWMFKKETLRRVPVNLYNPTSKVETNIEPGPGSYFKENEGGLSKATLNTLSMKSINQDNFMFKEGDTDRFGKPRVIHSHK